jgi:hypothetical protein
MSCRRSLAFALPVVVTVSSSKLDARVSTPDYCDGHVGADFCQLKSRIPCHDSTCQVGGRGPSYDCDDKDDLAACATRIATACAAMAGCDAFGLCISTGCPNNPPAGKAAYWVEYYNNLATSQPLSSGDWYYYYNETKLGPPPAPPPTCVPGPSVCPPAPPGSVFPPPGDYPPGCNSHGCTTLPTLLPTWTPTWQMNLSTVIMPCNYTGPTDPASTQGELGARGGGGGGGSGGGGGAGGEAPDSAPPFFASRLTPLHLLLAVVPGWAFLDFDWSNWKGTGDADGWAKHKPMDCEELMVKQVRSGGLSDHDPTGAPGATPAGTRYYRHTSSGPPPRSALAAR